MTSAGKITVRVKEEDIPRGTKGYGKTAKLLMEAGAPNCGGTVTFDKDISTFETIATWSPS